jgi:D-sedoheptulose 7-phosphate isomerase
MSDDVSKYSERYLKETVESLSGGYIVEGMQKIVPVLKKVRETGGTVFFFGNGGSASTASHMAVDISKCTIKEPLKRFRCISLPDALPTILAWANDASYADVFSEQLKNMGRPGDVAIGISGSGNSPNVLKALEEARRLKITTVGLIGMGGGKMKDLCDIKVIVPSHDMQHIEDVHLLIGHLLTAYLRDSK